MQFKVTGSNKDTGARMALEFEAESKAAAERKAIQQGMVVNRVQEMSEHAAEEARQAKRDAHRGEPIEKSKLPILITLLIILAVVAGVIYFVWPRIQALMGKGQ
ncbi:MAG TPA: hypothetical protein VL282_18375 [Tepidisphaeraceae bacterium]|jgi:hypothetical protein|nr:hypothetical protein [Tepidisphaeraceae bacterium]